MSQCDCSNLNEYAPGCPKCDDDVVNCDFCENEWGYIYLDLGKHCTCVGCDLRGCIGCWQVKGGLAYSLYDKEDEEKCNEIDDAHSAGYIKMHDETYDDSDWHCEHCYEVVKKELEEGLEKYRNRETKD